MIAVISESYERVMQNLVAEAYKVKANMIAEREQLFSNDDLNKSELFPAYIVVRRQIKSESNDGGEWQGFIKDLKYTIRTTSAKSKGEIIQNLQQSIGKLDNGNEQNLKLMSGELSEQIKILKQQFEKTSEDSGKEIKLIKEQQSQYKESILLQIDSIVQSLQAQSKDLDLKVVGVDTKIMGLDTKVENLEVYGKGLNDKIESLDSKVTEIQNNMEFIKDSMTLLLQKNNQ
ncbi:UNKNOWN [Stylonychia lemnae]|uniref:Uncharacterized protein n=1 Tax=Stylonychia lemnae TaxID=5949 RepID=A0A077ZRS5_STYLE|nr:UNKNOWN [Stylonychia lemnae]|eukprot:CDW72174.1 UNKNOWN [Stylonychia lemnae]